MRCCVPGRDHLGEVILKRVVNYVGSVECCPLGILHCNLFCVGAFLWWWRKEAGFFAGFVVCDSIRTLPSANERPAVLNSSLITSTYSSPWPITVVRYLSEGVSGSTHMASAGSLLGSDLDDWIPINNSVNTRSCAMFGLFVYYRQPRNLWLIAFKPSGSWTLGWADAAAGRKKKRWVQFCTLPSRPLSLCCLVSVLMPEEKKNAFAGLDSLTTSPLHDNRLKYRPPLPPLLKNMHSLVTTESDERLSLLDSVICLFLLTFVLVGSLLPLSVSPGPRTGLQSQTVVSSDPRPENSEFCPRPPVGQTCAASHYRSRSVRRAGARYTTASSALPYTLNATRAANSQTCVALRWVCMPHNRRTQRYCRHVRRSQGHPSQEWACRFQVMHPLCCVLSNFNCCQTISKTTSKPRTNKQQRQLTTSTTQKGMGPVGWSRTSTSGMFNFTFGLQYW